MLKSKRTKRNKIKILVILLLTTFADKTTISSFLQNLLNFIGKNKISKMSNYSLEISQTIA